MAFDINVATDKALNKIKILNASLDGISARITKINSKGVSLGRVGTQAANLKAQAGVGALGLQNLTTAVSQLKSQTDTVNAGITHLNGRFDSLGKRSKSASASLKNFRQGMNRTSQEAAALRAGMYATGTHFGAFTAQTLLAATAAYILVKSIVELIKTGASFEKSMARANAVMDNFSKTSNEVTSAGRAIEKEVRRLGKETVFTVSEVAEGLVFLGMAGLSSAEASKALEPVLNLASIGMLDMARAADIATNIMLGFGKEASDLEQIVDVMSVAITNSNANMEQMGNALSYVAPIARATNNTLEETTAILEVFHNVGIKSSRAGTSLRRALVNLSKPTDRVQAILTKLNVSLHDQENRMRPLLHIMRQFRDANADTSDILTIFGARAGPAMIELYRMISAEVDGSTTSLQKFIKQNENAKGSALLKRGQIEENLADDAKKLISAFSELSVVIFQELSPSLREATQSFTAFINSLNGKEIARFLVALKDGIAGTFGAVASLAGAVSDLASESIKSVTAMSAGKEQFDFMQVAVAALIGPLGLPKLVTELVSQEDVQSKVNKELKVYTTFLTTEAEATARISKLKRDLNAISLEELSIRKRISQEQKKTAELALAQSTRTEIAATNHLNKLLEKRKQLVESAASGSIPGGLADKELAQNKLRIQLAVKLVAAAKDNNRVTKEGFGLLRDTDNVTKSVLKTRKENIAAIQREKRELVNAALVKTEVNPEDAIAGHKRTTQELVNQTNQQEALGQISAANAVIVRQSIRDAESANITEDLENRLRIAKQLLSVSRSNLISHRDSSEGLGDTSARIKSFEDQKKAAEGLQKTLDVNAARLGKLNSKELEALQKRGFQVTTSMDNIWNAENESYKRRLEALRAYHTAAGTMNTQFESDRVELTFRTGAAQVAQAAGYIGQLVGMAAQASQRRYNISRQEAEDSYDLWQTANDRQEEFRIAANNAQTAGDANYYRNIQNQYKAYAATYKKQFEERDAIARKNFESNKSMQIAQTRINTIAGAAMVLSQLGYWGIPIAAGMVKLGQDMVSDIKSQQYQSPGADSSSGAFGGLPSAADNTSGIGNNITGSPRSDGQTNSVNVYIQGAITEEMINDTVLPILQDGINERDFVLISGTGEDSAQLSEVQGLTNAS